MIDNRVRVELHTGLMATLHHLYKFLAGATAASKLITYGLIALIPGTTEQEAMLIGGRDLHGEIALWSQKLFTFLGDIVPGPFKQMDENGGLDR